MQELRVNELIKQRRLVQAGYAAAVISYIACILILLADVRVSVILVNITTVLYFFVIRNMDKQYNRKFVKANLSLSCEKQLDFADVFCRGSVTGSHLKQSGMLPAREKGGAACGIGFRGEKGGIRAEVCELTVCFDRMEKNARTKVGILNGVWMELKLEKDTGRDLLLVERTAFSKGISLEHYLEMGYRELPVRAREISGRFCLFGGTGREEKESEAFLRKCKKLIQKTAKEGGGLMIQETDASLCVFLIGRKITFDTPLRGEITEDIVAWNRLPEFGMVMELGET